jgi:hypothetical protein
MAARDTAISGLNSCGLHEETPNMELGRYPQVSMFANGCVDGTANGVSS